MIANDAHLTPRQRKAMLRLHELFKAGTPTDDVMSMVCTALLHICLQSIRQGVSSPDEILTEVVTTVRASIAGITERTRPN